MHNEFKSVTIFQCIEVGSFTSFNGTSASPVQSQQNISLYFFKEYTAFSNNSEYS